MTDLSSHQLTLYKENPAQLSSLEDFKKIVKEWMELDNQIKKIQHILKEKKDRRLDMSVIISNFMCKYDIEDINTKDGRIRCKQVTVSKPVSKRIIKDRLNNYFDSKKDHHDSNQNIKDDILTRLYESEKVQRTSLRRLKVS